MALYLTEQDVQRVTDMPSVLAWVEAALTMHARGEAIDFPRQRTRLPQSMMHMLQGAVLPLGVSGYKVYTSSREGARFWTHLFASDGGRPLAVIESDYLGMMRTGAAGGVAAKYLARVDARTAAVFGAGWQARSQIMALCAVRPIATVKVYSRNEDKRASFCREMSDLTGRHVTPASGPAEAMEDAQIVVTITTSSKPLFEPDSLRPGMHLTGAGSNSLVRQEIPEAALRRANIVCVDSREVALREAGDLLPLVEKGRSWPGRWTELGEIAAGFRPGRSGPEDITVFESQGMAIQDLAVAAHVLARAREQGLGSELPY